MAKGKRGEAAALWDSGLTDLRSEDTEGTPLRLSSLAQSKAPTSPFAGLLQFGVNLPPDRGWVPRDKEAGAKDDSDWWYHPRSAEWIYRHADEIYFHLPTGGLWERREVPVAGAKEASPNYTYFRTDAVHMKALTSFASSLDSALIPMTFAAWVRYVQKRKKQATRNAQRASMLAASLSDDPQQLVGERGSLTVTAEQSQELGMDFSPTSPPLHPRARDKEFEIEIEIDLSPTSPPLHPRARDTDRGQPNSLQSSHGSRAQEGAGRSTALMSMPSALDVGPEAEVISGQKKSTYISANDSSGDAEDTDALTPVKSRMALFGFSFFCFRGKARPDRGPSPAPKPSPPSSEVVRQASAGARSVVEESIVVEASVKKIRSNNTILSIKSPTSPSSPTSPTKLANASRLSQLCGSETSAALQVPLPIRRLERFLAEARKNPEKLKNHVEKWREEKCMAAYVVGF